MDAEEIIIGLILLVLAFFGTILIIDTKNDKYDEKECVSYFIEHNYLLDGCEKYNNKLKEVK